MLNKDDLEYIFYLVTDKDDLALNYTHFGAVRERYEAGIEHLTKYPFKGKDTDRDIIRSLELAIKLDKLIDEIWEREF